MDQRSTTRRELLPDVELGLGNSIHVPAYRLSGLVPGALGLILADHFEWHIVFIIIALFMFVGIVMTLVIDEAIKDPTPPQTMASTGKPPSDWSGIMKKRARSWTKGSARRSAVSSISWYPPAC